MGSLLKVGVIGLGILGDQYVHFFQEHPQTRVVAVADTRSELAGRIGAATGSQGYTDYGEMLKAQALDLVVVATPDPYHRNPVVAALEAGVPNVIQEKPLATTLEDALAICEAVEQRQARSFSSTTPNRAAVRHRHALCDPARVAGRSGLWRGAAGRQHHRATWAVGRPEPRVGDRVIHGAFPAESRRGPAPAGTSARPR